MTINDLKKKNQEIKEDIDNAEEKAKETKAAIIETASDIKENISKIVDQSMDNVKVSCASLQKSAADYCKNNPFKAIGIALASGFIFSRLIS